MSLRIVITHGAKEAEERMWIDAKSSNDRGVPFLNSLRANPIPPVRSNAARVRHRHRVGQHTASALRSRRLLETGFNVAGGVERHGSSHRVMSRREMVPGTIILSRAPQIVEIAKPDPILFRRTLRVGGATRDAPALYSTREPAQNAFIESFNGKLGEECFNEHWFLAFQEAQVVIESWW